MTTTMDESNDHNNVARTEALFVSSLSAWTEPTEVEVTAVIRQTLRAYGGVRACGAEMAAAYGDNPESAVERMRWARRVVRRIYSDRGSS